jgi:glycosyltransferase involved in cell wall biosynthesis
MNILVSSNAPWSTSGYGNQTQLLTSRLKDSGHNVAISCFFGLEGGAIDWNGVRCYPTDHSRFGALFVRDYAAHHFGGDDQNGLVLLLQDVWVLMQGIQNYKGLKLAAWCPVDHDPAPPMVAQFLQQADVQTIAMSRFGEQRLQSAGVDTVGYIPHAVDTTIFSPQRPQRNLIRAGLKLPADAFVVGMVAANQGFPSRKSFPQVFEAFAEFRRRHNDAMLYLHADVLGRNHGVNLVELGKACGIPETALATSDQIMLHLGIPQELVAGVFNAFDVLCMPSMGEGFGIPLIEAQACGIPVITTDWTAMAELCGAGWLVDGDRWFDSSQNSFQKVPRVSEILDALEEAYENAEGMGGKAREFAVGYDVETVYREQWVPMMEQLGRPREIAPLRLAA